MPLKVDINLKNMTSLNSGWLKLLRAINKVGKYVALDLSGCVMYGTVFNPDSNLIKGKSFIVSLVLPEAAEGIAAGGLWRPLSFDHFTNLREITGTKVTAIGETTFRRCTSLTSVSFPEVTSIGFLAFQSTGLTNVSFPAAASIGFMAFENCTSLLFVSFPAVTSISSGAFNCCTSLTGINFPSAAIINNQAFQNCTSLTSASLPACTGIDGAAFDNCTSLASVTLGVITEDRFSAGWDDNGSFFPTFPGNLRDVYFAPGGGEGTYVTDNPGDNAQWRLS